MLQYITNPWVIDLAQRQKDFMPFDKINMFLAFMNKFPPVAITVASIAFFFTVFFLVCKFCKKKPEDTASAINSIIHASYASLVGYFSLLLFLTTKPGEVFDNRLMFTYGYTSIGYFIYDAIVVKWLTPKYNAIEKENETAAEKKKRLDDKLEQKLFFMHHCIALTLAACYLNYERWNLLSMSILLTEMAAPFTNMNTILVIHFADHVKTRVINGLVLAFTFWLTRPIGVTLCYLYEFKMIQKFDNLAILVTCVVFLLQCFNFFFGIKIITGSIGYIRKTSKGNKKKTDEKTADVPLPPQVLESAPSESESLQSLHSDAISTRDNEDPDALDSLVDAAIAKTSGTEIKDMTPEPLENQ